MAVIRARKLITDADIPAAIARDSETTQAVAAHVTALHPFPVFGFGQNVSSENVFNSGSGFLDCYSLSGGGIFPPGMSHIQGFQAKHSNPYAAWGMQLVTQYNIDNECFFRVVDEGNWKSWRRIWNDGNFNPANYPQFKRAIFTGNCPLSQNATTFVPHGLGADTIRGFTAFAIVYGGSISETRIPPGGAVAPWIGQSFYYSVDIGSSNINIRTSTNSNAVFGMPVTIVVDYV